MRYAWIEQHRDDYAVSRMCRLLAVSRTGYLQWRRRAPSARAQANARLDAQVAAMHAASKGSYGRPRIVRGLREEGLRVGPERVRRVPSAAMAASSASTASTKASTSENASHEAGEVLAGVKAVPICDWSDGCWR